VQDPRSYFVDNQLFDWNNLRAHAEHHGVHVNTSERFPNLALLKYKDEVQWGDKPWTEFARMSRGLVVDMKNQKILAYGYSKFFNMNQEPETNYEGLYWQKDFEVSEKLDGSCLVSFLNPNDNQFYLTTTGSFDSEHGQVGTELFRKLVGCAKIAAYAAMGTFIFELIDARFRIVIDYRKKNYPEGLYLIGYRDQFGRLWSYAEVAELATSLGFPSPKTYQFNSLDALLKNVENLTVLEEGFVLRYPGELLVKIKGPAYLKAHRVISQLSDRNILEAVAEGIADPLIEIAPEEYRQDVIDKIAYFKRRKLDLINQVYNYFNDAPKNDRKTFALWVNANVKSGLKGCMFILFDGKELRDKDIYGIIEKTEKPSVETRI
jgi:hypothetical protein